MILPSRAPRVLSELTNFRDLSPPQSVVTFYFWQISHGIKMFRSSMDWGGAAASPNCAGVPRGLYRLKPALPLRSRSSVGKLGRLPIVVARQLLPKNENAIPSRTL